MGCGTVFGHCSGSTGYFSRYISEIGDWDWATQGLIQESLAIIEVRRATEETVRKRGGDPAPSLNRFFHHRDCYPRLLSLPKYQLPAPWTSDAHTHPAYLAVTSARNTWLFYVPATTSPSG